MTWFILRSRNKKQAKIVLQNYLKDKPHVALSAPALLCFTTCIINFISFSKDGVIDSNELHQLLSTADGFETVVLVAIMFALSYKKK